MDRKLAGIRISRELKDLEDQLDTVLTAAARLSADVTEARVFYMDSAASMQRAIMRLGSMSELLIRARSKICQAHGDLGKAAAGTKDYPTDCPPHCWELELLEDAA
jgi:hypothetical protein